MKSKYVDICQKVSLALVAGAILLPMDAAAVPLPWWQDRFEQYPFGPGPAGSGGWTTWDNNPAGQGVIWDVACSAPKSVAVSGTTDLVRTFTGFTGGKYIVKASWYVPSTGGAGRTWFLILNTYAPGGPYDWSVQVGANRAAGTVQWLTAGTLQGVGSTPIGGGPGTLPLVLDQWVDVYSEIDLINDTVSTYYNNQLLATTPYRSSGTSVAEIKAINLYAEATTAVSFFDNLCSIPDRPRRYWQGRKDNYAAPDDAFYVTPALKSYILGSNPNPFWTGFDQGFPNRTTAFSFVSLPMGPCAIFKGKLIVNARPIGNASNDTFNLTAGTYPPFAYANTFAHATGTSWIAPNPSAATLQLNLGNMPANTGGFFGGLNLLPSISSSARLEYYAQDDTQHDSAELCLWTCRPFWLGSPVSTIGAATIAPLSDERLQVTFASGAESGIEVEMGEAQGGSLTFEPTPDLRVAGRMLTLKGEELFNGAGWTPVHVTRLTGYGSHATVQFDFSSIGSTQHDIALLDANGNVLSTFVRDNNVPISITSEARLISAWRNVAYYVRFGSSTTINGVSSGVTMCVVPRGPLSTWGSPVYQAMTVTGQNIGSLVLTGNTTVFNGAHVQGREGAHVTTTQDGVLIDPSPTDESSAFITVSKDKDKGNGGGSRPKLTLAMAVRELTPAPPTRRLEITPICDFPAAAPVGPLGTVRFLASGGNYQVAADFSVIGRSTYTVRVYRDGVMQRQVTGIPNGNFGNLADLPTGVTLPWNLTPETTDDPIICTWDFPNDPTLNIFGDPVVFDRLQISPDGAPVEFDSLVGQEMRMQGLGDVAINDIQIERTFAGQIQADGRVPGSYGGRDLDIDFIDPDTDLVVASFSPPLDADGRFSFRSNLMGIYRMAVKTQPVLRKAVNVVIGEDGLPNLTIAVTNGDCDNDNEIAISDYAILSAAYGTSLGDPGFNEDADLTGDEAVDIADYAVLSANYGLIGD
ncbi:MAG: hypothetical protein K1X67_06200 [Fimbriimonadaceae bacterium]|nr:hypothetical protein [Fimbriimonadaceae bacterium]